MNLQIRIEQPDTEPFVLSLEELLTGGRRLVMIGRKCEEVYNTIALDDTAVDAFQCCIEVTVDDTGVQLHLLHGQVRTECGKGLRSTYEIPCKHCHGRCMGLHPGRAIHYQRTPSSPTLLNDKELDAEGDMLKVGDIIEIGNSKIRLQQ